MASPTPPSSSPASSSSVSLSVSLIIAWIFSISLTFAVCTAAFQQPNAQDGMAFYGTYHQNKYNQLIHFFGVPGILFSAIVFGCHLTIPIKLKLPSILPGVLPPNDHYFSMGTFWMLFYTLYYLTIDPFGGTLFGPVLFGMYVVGVQWYITDQKKAQQQQQQQSSSSSSSSSSWSGTGTVLKFALWIQIASWYSQIHPGHAIFEGAKPALLTSLGQSFTNAPLFAFYEGVWFLGFRTELRDQVQQLVLENTKELCQSTGGAAMRVCSTIS